MIGKKWKIVEFYKDMLIYYRFDCFGNPILEFGNKNYTYASAKSIRSAKIRITKYINKLSDRQKKSLKYLKYEMKEV